jgi:hypothetical protein
MKCTRRCDTTLIQRPAEAELDQIRTLVWRLIAASLRFPAFAKRQWHAALDFACDAKLKLARTFERAGRAARRRLAMLYPRASSLRYRIQRRASGWGASAVILTICTLIVISELLAYKFAKHFEDHFSDAQLALLRNLLVTVGGALVGATAMGFSVVMIAVQLNFARIPHGLFRRLSSDFWLLGAFAATFTLAIAVAALSLFLDAPNSAFVLLTAGWATALILALFLYGYRRALHLINPLVQLRLVLASAQKDLRRWTRRARHVAPLLDSPDKDERGRPASSSHDMPRLAFFEANPNWTAASRRAIAHAISFARRYAEQGDYEVSGSALNAIIAINASYIEAKGKTFFASNAIFDIPQATDGFINESLEQLRQLVELAVRRGDEQQIRQVLGAMAGLVEIYLNIDYANDLVTNKGHAQLAASYLTGAVETVLPHDMPDVVMQGVRLMGMSAQLFLAAGSPNEIVSLGEKIAMIACAGAVKQGARAITLMGMEQLARLTFGLMRTRVHDVHFAAKQIRRSVELVAQVVLAIPDTHLSSWHSYYLAPYYSLTKTQTLAEWLAELGNAILRAEATDKDATAVLRNVEQWAEELYRTEKKLLLLAIEKKSHFTFDITHWIAHVTKVLAALSQAPVADDHIGKELEKHASWLISVLSWIPDDKDVISFVETFSITELIFEAALDALASGSDEVAAATRRLLMSWSFKGGRYHTGWGIFEKSLLALATLVLWKEDLGLIPWLKLELTKGLNDPNAPDQEIRDRTARELRRRAATLRRREFELNRLENAATQVDAAKLKTLLNEIADSLSPGTSSEPVELRII